VDRGDEEDAALDEVKFEHNEEEDLREDVGKAIEVSVDLLKNTPLLWAAHKGKLGVIWHLLEDGYSPNDVDKMENNALHLAAAQGDLKILKVLIDDGVVANVVNLYKNHPIDMSKSKEVRDMIAVAMEVGASMTEKDIADKHEKNIKQVCCPVEFVAVSCYVDIVKLPHPSPRCDFGLTCCSLIKAPAHRGEPR